MMDYRAWFERYQRFFNRWQDKTQRDSTPEARFEYYLTVDPPLTDTEIQQLRVELDCRLPDSVAGFLSQVGSRLRAHFECRTADGVFWAGGDLFNYWMWEPGGKDHYVGCLEGMPTVRAQLLDTFDENWFGESEAVLERAFRRHGLPLMQNGGTDCLVLWAHALEETEPAVVWVPHDDESRILAPSFDEYLRQWEYIGYGDTEPFTNWRTGSLDKNHPDLLQRRRLLGLADPTKDPQE
jgi:SMI1 / KNR4 family (SUKH-1)